MDKKVFKIEDYIKDLSPELQEKARLVVVSSTSIVEGGAHDVITKNNDSTIR